jgi:hypothetical protein
MFRKMADLLYGDPINLPRLSTDSGLPVQLLREIFELGQSQARLLVFKKKDVSGSGGIGRRSRSGIEWSSP